MLENRNVDGLVQLQQHSWVKLYLFVVSDEFKHEGLVEDGVTGGLNDLGAEPVLQEAACNGDLLVGAHIHEVDECVALEDRAAHVPLVGVEVISMHRTALAGGH